MPLEARTRLLKQASWVNELRLAVFGACCRPVYLCGFSLANPRQAGKVLLGRPCVGASGTGGKPGLHRDLIITLEREGVIGEPQQERRATRRFDMRLPARVKLTGSGFHELVTETLNVSARGVFFYIDRSVEHGTKIEVTLTLPSHVTLTESVRVRFTARVVRVEAPLPFSRIGVAAVIEEYEFLPSPHTSEAMNAS